MAEPLHNRLKDLQASLEEYVIEPVLGSGAWLVCDGCGAVADLDPVNPVPPDDWVLNGPDQDYCPRCS